MGRRLVLRGVRPAGVEQGKGVGGLGLRARGACLPDIPVGGCLRVARRDDERRCAQHPHIHSVALLSCLSWCNRLSV